MYILVVPIFLIVLIGFIFLITCFIELVKLGWDSPPYRGNVRRKETHRKRNGTQVWHFSDICPDWPRENFQEIPGPPEIQEPIILCGICYRIFELAEAPKVHNEFIGG